MGLQDMSYGLTEANVLPTSLTWVGDEEHNRDYHRLEDVYARFAPWLRSVEIIRRWAGDSHAWWVIGGGKRLLVPLISLENDGGPHHARDLEIDLSGLWPAGDLAVVEYDFTSPDGRVLGRPEHLAIRVDDLPYLAFRLFEPRTRDRTSLTGRNVGGWPS